MIRSLLALGVSLSLLIAALVYWRPANAPPEQIFEIPSKSSPSGLRPRDCRYPSDAQFEVQCYHYALASEGQGLQLSVAVFRSQSKNTASDPLLYLAGGPGEGGQTLPERLDFWRHWLDETGLERDFVLVDPRGNMPGDHWDCPAYSELSRALLAQNLSFSEEGKRLAPVVEKCLEDYDRFLRERLLSEAAPKGAGLKTMRSHAKAEDSREVMRALDYAQWNLLAVSYGTRVALLAAAHQPEVRRIILDGPYPPLAGTLVAQSQRWLQAFERYFVACEQGLICPEESGPEVRQLFWQLMADLQEQPVSLRSQDWFTRREQLWVLNDGRLALLAHFSFYSRQLRSQLLPALEALQEGDSGPLEVLAEFFYNQAFVPSFNAMVYLATECNDNPRGGAAEFEQFLEGAGPWRPYMEQDWAADPCRNPIFGEPQSLRQALISQPVLVVTGAFDPVTPPEYAEQLRAYLSQGHWLVLPGRGHGEFFADACGYHWIPNFLNAPSDALETQNFSAYPACH